MKTLARNLVNNQSMENNYTSESVIVYYMKYYSLQYSWTGTPEGSLFIEVSNCDLDDSECVWTTIDKSEFVVSGEAGNLFLEALICTYRKLRISWIPTIGTGVLNVKIIGKGE